MHFPVVFPYRIAQKLHTLATFVVPVTFRLTAPVVGDSYSVLAERVSSECRCAHNACGRPEFNDVCLDKWLARRNSYPVRLIRKRLNICTAPGKRAGSSRAGIKSPCSC